MIYVHIFDVAGVVACVGRRIISRHTVAYLDDPVGQCSIPAGECQVDRTLSRVVSTWAAVAHASRKKLVPFMKRCFFIYLIEAMYTAVLH